MRHNRRARHKRAKKRSRMRDWRFWSYRRRGVEMATKMAFLRMEAQRSYLLIGGPMDGKIYDLPHGDDSLQFLSLVNPKDPTSTTVINYVRADRVFPTMLFGECRNYRQRCMVYEDEK